MLKPNLSFSDDSSQVGNLYLEQKSDVSSTMVPLAAVSSIHQNSSVPSDDLTTMVTVNLTPNESVLEENKYQTMTITALPTISQDVDTIQGDYSPIATIETLGVAAVSKDSNIAQGEDFSSMDTIKKISIEQLTQRPVKFKVNSCLLKYLYM